MKCRRSWGGLLSPNELNCDRVALQDHLRGGLHKCLPWLDGLMNLLKYLPVGLIVFASYVLVLTAIVGGWIMLMIQPSFGG